MRVEELEKLKQGEKIYCAKLNGFNELYFKSYNITENDIENKTITIFNIYEKKYNYDYFLKPIFSLKCDYSDIFLKNVLLYYLKYGLTEDNKHYIFRLKFKYRNKFPELMLV